MCRPVAKGVDNVLESTVKGLREVEWVVQDAVSQFAAVRAYFVKADLAETSVLKIGGMQAHSLDLPSIVAVLDLA